MNEGLFEKRFNSSDIVVNDDEGTNIPAGSAEPIAEAVLMDETPYQETSMGGTVAEVVYPLDQEIVQESPVDEAIPLDAPKVGDIPFTPMGETYTHEAPVDKTIIHEATFGTNSGTSAALLKPEESEHFRTRWNEIQGQFVDEPRTAVQQADALVSEVIAQLTQMFASEHSSLEEQWKQGNDVSTEDLRLALQRYRTFFNRLVV